MKQDEKRKATELRCAGSSGTGDAFVGIDNSDLSLLLTAHGAKVPNLVSSRAKKI